MQVVESMSKKDVYGAWPHCCHHHHLLLFFPSLLSSCSEAGNASVMPFCYNVSSLSQAYHQ